MAALNASEAVMYSCSFFNPLLYYWRIKEITDSVRSIIRNIFWIETKRRGTLRVLCLKIMLNISLS